MTTCDRASESGNDQAPAATLGDYARWAIAAGWCPIELWGVDATGECVCTRKESCKPGKHPVGGGWRTAPQMSIADTYAVWDTATRPRNVGILTGAVSGFWVLDIDPKDNGDEGLKSLEALHGRLPVTRVHRTGSGGLHYLFSMPDDFELGNSSGRLPTGIDVRGNGGYIVAPGSTSSVGTYRTLVNADIVPAPSWLLELIRPQTVEQKIEVVESVPFADLKPEAQEKARKYLSSSLEGEVRRLTGMKSDASTDPSQYRGAPWNQTVYDVCCNLLELAQSQWIPFGLEEIKKILIEHAPTDAGFTMADVMRRLASAQNKVRGQARDMPATITQDTWAMLTAGIEAWVPVSDDAGSPLWPEESWNQVGNVKRTVRMAAGRLVWVPERQAWFECGPGGSWSQSRAPRDDTAAKWCARAMEAAVMLEAHNYDDAPGTKKTSSGRDVEDKSKRDKFIAFMEESSKVEMHTAVSTQLRRRAQDYGIEIAAGAFDSDPYAFACANGLLDLRTGSIREILPSDYVSVVSPVEYNPEMPIPHFERFLESSHPDADVRSYLQKVLGYSMIGLPVEQKMFIHYGAQTANGKSVLMNVLSRILGDHFQPAPEKALLKQRAGSSRIGQDMLDLVGPRFLALNETSQGATLDSEVIKSLTAGDERSDRAHYSRNTKYRVTGKIHLVTNHLPHITADEAMARRIVVIPWTQSFRDNPDPDLEQKLLAELPGILAWLVAGAARWWSDREASGKTGLVEPALCLAAKTAYLEEEDELGAWLSECCTILDAKSSPTSWTPVKNLYPAYTQWRFAQGFQSVAMSPNAFGRALTGKGHDVTGTRISGVSVKVRPIRLTAASNHRADPFGA